jgi:chromosome segregation ATPase
MSDKPLYDELMNVAAEIGELEVENGILKNKVENLTMAFETSKKTVEKLIQKRDELELVLSHCQGETSEKLESQVKTLENRVRYYKNEVLELNVELEKIKTDIKAKGFKARLKYLFTGEMED